MGNAFELARVIEATMGPLAPELRDALVSVDRAQFVREVDRELAFENLALPLDTPDSPAAPPVADMIAAHGSWLAAALQPAYSASGEPRPR